MPIFEWIWVNLIDNEEGDMGEIIQNFEYAHPNFIEEEIADDVDIVEKKLGKYIWMKLRMW